MDMELMGMKEFKTYLEQLKKHAPIYNRGAAKIPDVVMDLAAGNGQSYVAEYLADFLRENGLYRFGGLEDILEYRLTGSLNQIRKMFQDINDHAVYTNYYQGVIAVDISGLAQYANEEQTGIFINGICDVGRDAVVIFYYNPVLESKIKDVIKKIFIKKGEARCRMVYTEPYSCMEYAEMILTELTEERGILVKNEMPLKELVWRILNKIEPHTVRNAFRIVDRLVLCTDPARDDLVINLGKVRECFGIEATDYQWRAVS